MRTIGFFRFTLPLFVSFLCVYVPFSFHIEIAHLLFRIRNGNIRTLFEKHLIKDKYLLVSHAKFSGKLYMTQKKSENIAKHTNSLDYFVALKQT